MSSPFGSKESFNLLIKDIGGNLTIVILKHPALQGDFAGTGTVKGDAVTMELKSVYNGMTLKFVGKVEGDKITGTREFGQLPQGSFSEMEAGAPSAAPVGAREGRGRGERGAAPKVPAVISNVLRLRG
jgi:hypothetical protein